MYNLIYSIMHIIITITSIASCFLIIYLMVFFTYKIVKMEIKRDIKNGNMTDYNKLLLNMNNKINNIEKEIKEMKKE